MNTWRNWGRPIDIDRVANPDTDPPVPSHAVDVLQLLERRWTGPRPRKDQSPPQEHEAWSLASPTQPPALPAGVTKGTARPPSPLWLRGAAVVTKPSSQAAADRHRHPPTAQQEPPPEAAAVQGLPGIGTWACRQRLFDRNGNGAGPLLPHFPPGHGSTSINLEEAAAAAAAAARPVPAVRGSCGTSASLGNRQPPAPEEGGISSTRSSVRSQDAREAAWRWRFSRKWEVEQKKFYTEDASTHAHSLVSLDELDAIHYTQACGMGENLQFEPPLLSITRESSLQTSLSCQFDLTGHGGCQALGELSEAATAQDLQSPAGGANSSSRGHARQQARRGGAPWLTPTEECAGPEPSATKMVLSMVSRARDLLQKQQEIEQEVQSRWERSMCGGDGEAWAGQHLRPVRIGMSGRFRFVVLRAVDSRGHQRYLVRGRSGASPAELAEEAAQEAAAACRRKALPEATIELVGDGVMVWREDTDRHLHVAAAPNAEECLSGGAPGTPKRAASKGDVTGLAASLVRQELPSHFQVSASSEERRELRAMDVLRI